VAESEPAIVVCDAGPIIHLDELKCLDLLAYYETIYVPKAVWREVRRHRPSALRRRRVKLTVVKEIPEAHLELEVLIRAFSLNQGEIEALRLTQAFPKATLLTDDAAARLVA
jgi:predicted nucleic acid-binding protein